MISTTKAEGLFRRLIDAFNETYADAPPLEAFLVKHILLMLIEESVPPELREDCRRGMQDMRDGAR
jgi:hypothetical protein